MEAVETTIGEHFMNKGMQKGRLEGRQEGMQKGRQEGMQKGRQEGRQEGGAMILSRLMASRYRMSPDESFASLKGLGTDDMAELAEEIMKCDSLDDIKLWILKRKK